MKAHEAGLNRAGHRPWMLFSAIAIAVMILMGPTMAFAAENVSTIARGGLLYDKWFKVVGAEKPADTHAAYPAEGKKKGDTTWRCKECHGWDYEGVNGAYASGSHFSGIKGVSGMAGADVGDVVAILKDSTHGLTNEMMDEADFQALALFISQGQFNMDPYIERATKSVNGDTAQGEIYYNTLCANCHGRDGTMVKDMKPMGKVVSGNPWEALHKVLNGQPGEQMPALRALDIQVALDILKYTQSLPKEK